MNTATNCKHSLARHVALRAAAFIASATLLHTTCGSVVAQAQQPGKSQKADESQGRSPSRLDRAVDQLTHSIEGLEFDLPRMRERFGPTHPMVVQSQMELTKLRDLQKRLVQLSQGQPNEIEKAEMSRLLEDIAAATSVKP